MPDDFIVVENTTSPDVPKILCQAFTNAEERNSKGVENGFEIATLAEEIRLWDRHQKKQKREPETEVPTSAVDLLIVAEITTSTVIQNGLQQAFKKAAENNAAGTPNGVALAALAKQIRLYERDQNKQKKKTPSGPVALPGNQPQPGL